ncbi:MAG: hypothetical protein WAQ52_10375 [Terriglobales bacterium]
MVFGKGTTSSRAARGPDTYTRVMVYTGKARTLSAFLSAVLCCFLLSPYSASQDLPLRTIHVFVALADNEHQGIVPVPARLGNGLDPAHNLYWGAAAGVKTIFARSADWALVNCGPRPKPEILERCVFKHRRADVYLVADAYRGDEIRQAILDFFDAAAGGSPETIALPSAVSAVTLTARGGSDLVAYVGHDGLMDFQLPLVPHQKSETHRDAIILACASKQYFSEPLRASGANPLLWTTGLMAPEAYTLKAALDGWISGETSEQVHERAAAAYDKYQKCGMRAARRLFATGW